MNIAITERAFDGRGANQARPPTQKTRSSVTAVLIREGYPIWRDRCCAFRAAVRREMLERAAFVTGQQKARQAVMFAGDVGESRRRDSALQTDIYRSGGEESRDRGCAARHMRVCLRARCERRRECQRRQEAVGGRNGVIQTSSANHAPNSSACWCHGSSEP